MKKNLIAGFIIFTLLFILNNISFADINSMRDSEVITSYEKGGLNLAETEYKKLIKKNSKDENTYAAMAYIYYQENKPENLIKICLEGVKKIPNSYVLYNYLGSAYNAMDEEDKAIEAYSKSIEIFPSEPPFFNRGDIWLEKKNYDKAIQDYTKALEYIDKEKDLYSIDVINNRKADIHDAIATVYFAKKDFLKAIDNLNMVINYSKNDIYAYRDRARAKIMKTVDDVENNKISISEANKILNSALEDLDIAMKYAREQNNAEAYNEILETKKFIYKTFGSKK